MATDPRAAAAARAKQKAQENQSKHAGRGHLKTDIKILEPKDGQQTLLTVIPYTVTEKHHPDGIPAGELWYKRPYKLHGGLGSGDEKHRKPCPNTFNPRIACNVCHDISSQVAEIRSRKNQLSKKELEEEIANAAVSKAKNRDLLLVFNHEDKQIYLLDQAYGGGNMVGFGMLLDSRIANARETEWAAFWLPREYGMALDIQWRGAGLGGSGRDWIKPISIDFVPRKKAEVPDWVWGKSVDLSSLLHHTTVKEIDDLYFGYSESDDNSPASGSETSLESKFDRSTSESDEEPSPPEDDDAPKPGEEELEPPNDEDDIPFEPDFGGMNKEALLKFAETYGLMYKDRPVHIAYAKTGESDIRKAVSILWNKLDPKPQPKETKAVKADPTKEEAKPARTRTVGSEKPAKSATRSRTTEPEKKQESGKSGKCPDGGEFGKDFSERPGCNSCPEELYQECAKANG